MLTEPELSPRVVANLTALATTVLVAWYRAVGVDSRVTVVWRTSELLRAVWSEN